MIMANTWHSQAKSQNEKIWRKPSGGSPFGYILHTFFSVKTLVAPTNYLQTLPKYILYNNMYILHPSSIYIRKGSLMVVTLVQKVAILQKKMIKKAIFFKLQLY